MKRIAVGALVLASLAGCSQVAALAPVGGDRMAEVRFAAIDVLLDQGVELREAPVCTTTGDAISCLGSTSDGRAVEASILGAGEPLTVLVDGETLYLGPLMDVLDKAARP